MKEKWVVFTEKHAEIWKFIKFTFTGASTSVLELAVFAFLQYVVFKSMNTTPVTDNAVLHFLGIQYKGYMYSYAISAIIGYAAAYVMNRKLTFQADANPVLSTMKYFRDEYIAHITHKTCPAGVCKSLISYVIDPAKC